ncbi:MAG: ribonuclease HII [Oscillospiraceae bacterium]|nr:ribonuclease HII [Oscillospiraceae bacterium]
MKPEKETTASLWEIERACRAEGYAILCGVDEAGAGPLAGDVYAAVVILPEGWTASYLNDSKKVTPKRREVLFEQIRSQAVSWALGTATAEEIDRLDILNCRMLAMNRAIAGLSSSPDLALVDGNRNHGSQISIEVPNRTFVGGDSRSASIAAASVLAKVARDHYMVEMAARYPEYGFDQHKGYGTKAHYEALRTYGPCPIHRKTFLKNL